MGAGVLGVVDGSVFWGRSGLGSQGAGVRWFDSGKERAGVSRCPAVFIGRSNLDSEGWAARFLG